MGLAGPCVKVSEAFAWLLSVVSILMIRVSYCHCFITYNPGFKVLTIFARLLDL